MQAGSLRVESKVKQRGRKTGLGKELGDEEGAWKSLLSVPHNSTMVEGVLYQPDGFCCTASLLTTDLGFAERGGEGSSQSLQRGMLTDAD